VKGEVPAFGGRCWGVRKQQGGAAPHGAGTDSRQPAQSSNPRGVYSSAAATPDGSAGVARGQEGAGRAGTRGDQPRAFGEAPGFFGGAGAGDDPQAQGRHAHKRSAADAAIAAATAAATAVADDYPQAQERERKRSAAGPAFDAGAAFDADAAAAAVGSDVTDTDDAYAPPAKKGRSQAHGQLSSGAAKSAFHGVSSNQYRSGHWQARRELIFF
jgi:hypothetical protein